MRKPLNIFLATIFVFSFLILGKMTGFAASGQFLDAIVSNVTYNANSYVIDYALYGGTNHEKNPSHYSEQSPTIYLSSPSRAGFSFEGWFTNAQYTGSMVTIIPFGSTGNRTLHAKWSVDFATVLQFAGTTQYTVRDSTSPIVANHLVIPSIHNESSVIGVEASGFRGNQTIYNLTVEEGVVTLGANAFRETVNLSTVILPSTLESIDTYAFEGASSLSALVLNRSVLHGSITAGAAQMLANTSPTLKIFIPKNSIDAYRAAPYWSNFASRFVPLENLHSNYAITPVAGGVAIYQYIGYLPVVNVPAYINGQLVVEIGAQAFANNKTLQSITLPNTISSIGNHAFANNTSLTSFTLNRTSAQGITTAGINLLHNHHASLVVYVPNGSLATYQTATNWTPYSALMIELQS